jgi:hypothetical protein
MSSPVTPKHKQQTTTSTKIAMVQGFVFFGSVTGGGRGASIASLMD